MSLESSRLLLRVTEKIPVKIKCPECSTYYHVSGPPIRGAGVIETTHAVDYIELEEHELAAWQRWFWACPRRDCETVRSQRGPFIGGLEYYIGRPVIADK
jgi:hypothetical protein